MLQCGCGKPPSCVFDNSDLNTLSYFSFGKNRKDGDFGLVWGRVDRIGKGRRRKCDDGVFKPETFIPSVNNILRGILVMVTE